MANSYSVHTVDSAVSAYNIGFAYLREAYLKIKINDVITEGFTVISNGTQVDITGLGALDGDTLKIYRSTPISDSGRLVQWLDGAFLNQEDLNTAQVQLLHAIQESVENPGDTTTLVGIPSGGTADYVLTKNTGDDYDVSWQAAAAGSGIPSGGTADQLIVKQSGVDGDVAWETLAASKVSNDAVGFVASTVKDALEELLAISGVVSFNTRSGAVVPAAGDYNSGQISVGVWSGGTHDYVLDALNFLYSSKAGAGDVFGPSSSTANTVVRFADSSGKNIKQSSLLVSDAVAISGVSKLSVDAAGLTADSERLVLDGTATAFKTGTGVPAAPTVTGETGDVYIARGAAPDIYICKSTDTWKKIIARDAVQMNRGFCSVIHPGSTTTLGSGLVNIDWNSAASVLNNGFSESESGGAGTGYDTLIWQPLDARTAKFYLDFKMTVRNTDTGGTALEARCIPYKNGGAVTSSILYVSTTTRQNSKCSSSVSSIVELAFNDTLVFQASYISGGSILGNIDNFGFAVTLIEISSDSDG